MNYGVPQFLWPHILYYRSDLYAEHGLPAPDSWDNILANAQALNNPPDIYGYFTYLLDAHPKMAWSLMPAHDAYVFDENGNNSINSEGNRRGAQAGEGPGRRVGSGRGGSPRGSRSDGVHPRRHGAHGLVDLLLGHVPGRQAGNAGAGGRRRAAERGWDGRRVGGDEHPQHHHADGLPRPHGGVLRGAL